MNNSLIAVRLVQMDGAVDELFLNVTPLHRAEPYIQSELNKLQLSVTQHPRIIRMTNTNLTWASAK